MTPESIYPAKSTLGEGPVWSPQESALYWVDIIQKQLHRWQPANAQHELWTLPSEIGSYALREQGGAVVALKSGLHFFDFASGALEAVCDPEAELTDNRFNDGKCDRQGRFWAGTMGSGETAVGSLYRLDSGGECHTMRGDLKISNGLGWSPDNATFYLTDSPLQTIFAYDFDVEAGTLSGERVFAKIDEGSPDGMTVDSEGYVWSAVWDGWRVNRFAPDGTLTESVDMPVQRPTSCMFGGESLDELYITSASVGLSDAELSEQPEAGSIFRVKTEVKGLPEPRFKG